MTVLVDSNALLFSLLTPERLSSRARTLLEDRENTLVFSVASMWEIVIKSRLGKLHLGGPVATVLSEEMDRLGMQLLPVEQAHALRVAALAPAGWTDSSGHVHRHADPFGRLLVAQAQIEGLPILSADEQLDRYEIDRIW